MTNYTSHPDYRHLLAAVLAQPADDLPRLVLADWLDEHGQPERAEFIRVQIELAARRAECGVWAKAGGRGVPPMWDSDRGRWLMERELALLPDDLSGLIAKLGVTTTQYPPEIKEAKRHVWRHGYPWVKVRYKRGFPQVRCTLADWCGGECPDCDPTNTACPTCARPGTDSERTGYTLGIGPAVVRSHPVERVVLMDREPASMMHGVFRWHGDQPTGYDAPESVLPRDVFSHLGRADFATREEANAAASAAAIAWAKSQEVRA